MIVATAGHIDHGKTALVKALTGVDADRLPEEKARGITLDLGFAYRRTGATALGFVDVPGHERLVRTMVAGASGVDCALLVVAADDGVMPQTREHLAILDLLGLPGLVAITKADRVAPDRLEAVRTQVRALVAGTGLADAPLLACSARTGDGLGEIAAGLERLDPAGRPAPPERGAGFRLAVDRAFSLPGVGLIVTGAVHAGLVRVGDRLLAGPAAREVRVRGLRAQDAEAREGGMGTRLALNLVGPRLSRADVGRGDWVLAGDLHAPTSRLDARLRLLPSEARALAHRTPVQVHLGAAMVSGRVLLLEAAPLRPGESGLVQLTLDGPIGALAGDRFVLRDVSARRTLGGGRVIDPFGPSRGMRTPARRALLSALDTGDDAGAFAQAVHVSENGLDLDAFRLARNLGGAVLDRLTAADGVVAVAGPTGRLGYSGARFADLCAGLAARLDAAHAAEPDDPGRSADELQADLPRGLHPALRPALDALLREGRVRRYGALFRRPGHVPRLRPVDEESWQAIRAALDATGLDQPRLALLAERLREEPDAMRPLLVKLARLGRLTAVSRAYFLLPGAVRDLARIAEAVAAAHPEGLLTVGRFREAAGIGRNLTMPLLEHFDAVGFTLRLDEGRRIRGDHARIFAPSAPDPEEEAG